MASDLAAVLAAVVALTSGAVAPATAGPAPVPPHRAPAGTPEPVVPPFPDDADATWPFEEGASSAPTHTERLVAPGVRLTSYDRLGPDDSLRADALSIDLTSGAEADYLSPGAVASRRALSRMAAEHDPGPGRRTVAAVNADFFDINETGAPQGFSIKGGEVVSSPVAGANRAVGIGPGDSGRVLELDFQGTLSLPTGTRPLASLNAANVPEDGIGAYTSGWGAAHRGLTVNESRHTTEVTVVDGRVARTAGAPGSGPVPPGTTVLVGRDAGADVLAALRAGDPVSWWYRPRPSSGQVPRTAVGGRELLVVNGGAIDHEGEGNNKAAPRTAVGFTRDGHTMLVLTVDGRQRDSDGVTLTELGLLMKHVGAHNALNLDGGGSSTLLARAPDGDSLRLENSPSGGRERPVPNGLVFTVPEGAGPSPAGGRLGDLP